MPWLPSLFRKGTGVGDILLFGRYLTGSRFLVFTNPRELQKP